MPVIWISDGEPFEVEWYTSDGKLTGVQRVSEHFMAREVSPKRDTGFRIEAFDARYDAMRRYEPRRDPRV